jgi:excinuclease ABC subunit A
VIEHNLEVIKTPTGSSTSAPRAAMAAARKPALGLDPRVAAGTPEDVVKVKRSYTGQFLAPVLGRAARGKKKRVEAAE